MIDDIGILKERKRTGMIDDLGIIPVKKVAKPLPEITPYAPEEKYVPVGKTWEGASTLGISHPEQAKAGRMLRQEKEYQTALQTAKDAMARQPDVYKGMTPEDVLKRQYEKRQEIGEVTAPAVDPLDFATFVFGGGLPSLAKTALKGTAKQVITKGMELGLKSTAIGVAQLPIGQTTDIIADTELGKRYPHLALAFNLVANGATIYGIDRAVNSLKDSNLWRTMTIKERSLVLQSIDDLKKNGFSEGKIARYYPTYKEDLIKQRMAAETGGISKPAVEPADQPEILSKAVGKPTQPEVLDKMGVPKEKQVEAIVKDAVVAPVNTAEALVKRGDIEGATESIAKAHEAGTKLIMADGPKTEASVDKALQKAEVVNNKIQKKKKGFVDDLGIVKKPMQVPETAPQLRAEPIERLPEPEGVEMKKTTPKVTIQHIVKEQPIKKTVSKTGQEPDFQIMSTEQPKIRQYKTVQDVIQGFKEGEIDYEQDKWSTIPYSDIKDKVQFDERVSEIPSNSKISITKDFITIKEPSVRNEEGDVVKGKTHKFRIIKQKVANILKQQEVSYLGDAIARGTAGETAMLARKTIKEIFKEDKDFANNPTFTVKVVGTDKVQVGINDKGQPTYEDKPVYRLEFKIDKRQYAFRPEAISKELWQKLNDGEIKEGQTIRVSPGYLENKNPELFLVKGAKKPVGLADIGGYADLPRTSIELPEIVELARDINSGKYPVIKKKLRSFMGTALGQFSLTKGKISLKADIFKDPVIAAKVLAHEIGHLVDWLPDQIMARGNILGRIATLYKYYKSLLQDTPHSPFSLLTKEDRAKLRQQAEKTAKEQGLRKSNTPTPEEIVAIWNDVDGSIKLKSPELYDFVARMSSLEKMELAKAAIAGRLPGWFRFNYNEETTPDLVKKIYRDLVEEEIVRRNLVKREDITEELKKLTQIWKPFDENASPTFTKYRYSSKELYADAFSVLLNDPELLKQTAPKFYNTFFNWFEKKPEVQRVYDELQSRENILVRRDQEIDKMFARSEEELAKANEPEKLTKHSILDSLKRELVDVNATIQNKVKSLKKQGIDIPPEDNPVYWLEELPYTSSKVAQYLRDVNNKIKFVAQNSGISDIDIGKYLFLKRVSTERAEIANPLGHTPETAQQHLQYMRAKLGDFKMAQLEQLATEFWNIRQTVLQDIEDSQLFSPDLVEQLKDNQFYATFDVQKYIEERYGKGIGAKIYKQIGTLNEITNPFTATVMKDMSLIRAADIKNVTAKTVDFLHRYAPDEIESAKTRWNGRYHEPVEPRDPRKGLVVMQHEGKIMGYYVDKNIAKTFSKDPYEAGIILRAFQMISQPLKEILVSKNPFFMLWNIQRDIRALAKQVPGGTIPKSILSVLKSIPDAYKDVFKELSTPDVEQMYRNKMLIVGRNWGARYLSEESQLDRLLLSFTEGSQKYDNNIVKPFRLLWDWLDKPGKFVERLTKIAGYKMLKNFDGLTPKEKAHIIRTRSGSPDFKRSGSLAMLYNNVFLFSNAGKEGWRAAYESFKGNKSGYIWKTLKYDIIPKLIMYGAGIGLLGKGMKELMDAIPQRDKTNYMTVPIGATKQGKTIYFVVPHDFTGQLISGLMWNTLNMRKPGDVQQVADYLAGGIPYSGLNPTISTTADIIQYLSGKNPYDSWSGRYVIPELTFEAGGKEVAKVMTKHIFNNMGGSSILYRFRTDDYATIKSDIERVIDTPFAGKLVDRFLRVSDRGIYDELRGTIKDVRSENAQTILKVRSAVQKLSQGEQLDADDIKAIAQKPDLVDDYVKQAIVKKYGNAFMNVLVSSRSNAEKVAIINRMMEMKGNK